MKQNIEDMNSEEFAVAAGKLLCVFSSLCMKYAMTPICTGVRAIVN